MVLASYAVRRLRENYCKEASSNGKGKPEAIIVNDVLSLDENCSVQFTISERYPQDEMDNNLIITYVDNTTSSELELICLQDLPSDVAEAIRNGELHEVYDSARNITLRITKDNFFQPDDKGKIHSRLEAEQVA